MFKKLLLAAVTTTIISASANALADSLYMGPSIVVQDAFTNSSFFRGVSPKMTLGYGSLGDEAYFAAEAYLMPTSIVLTNNSSPSLKMSRSLGFSVIPGLVIGPQTVGFLRAGLVTTKFSSADIYKTGAQFGLGLMTNVSPNWDVRAEYDFSFYGAINELGSPKIDEYALAFLYRFEDTYA